MFFGRFLPPVIAPRTTARFSPLMAWPTALLGVLFSASALASVDIPGSADPANLQRYPLSYIVEYQQRPDPEYWLALGPMRKVNGVIRPETSEAVAGELIRITYRVPDGHDSGDAFAHLADQLRAQGYVELYQCAGRRCGSSNQWANAQFGIAQLYGVDRDQYYGAFRSVDAGRSVALYSVRRGNKRVYLHLDLIGRSAAAGAPAGAERLILQPGQRHFVVLGDPLDSLASALMALQRQDPALQVRLVGHSRRGSDAAARQAGSLVDAERVRDQLIVLGVPERLLHPYGVGDLAPAYDPAVPAERVELVLE